jgi:hypothetical protein
VYTVYLFTQGKREGGELTGGKERGNKGEERG